LAFLLELFLASAVSETEKAAARLAAARLMSEARRETSPAAWRVAVAKERSLIIFSSAHR
jgi:hypothetical protein